MNILLILTGFIIAFVIVFYYERKIKLFRTESRNRVHFYVARDKDGRLWLYIGKPIRNDVEFHPDLNKNVFVLTHYLKHFGLKYEDYANLKWEDEPVEAFINMED